MRRARASPQPRVLYFFTSPLDVRSLSRRLLFPLASSAARVLHAGDRSHSDKGWPLLFSGAPLSAALVSRPCTAPPKELETRWQEEGRRHEQGGAPQYHKKTEARHAPMSGDTERPEAQNRGEKGKGYRRAGGSETLAYRARLTEAMENVYAPVHADPDQNR